MKIDPNDLTKITVKDYLQMPGGARLFIKRDGEWSVICIPRSDERDESIEFWEAIHWNLERGNLYRRISKPWCGFFSS